MFDIFKTFNVAKVVIVTLGNEPIDLSGAAKSYYWHSEKDCKLRKVTIVYSEASSADAGINVKMGKEADDDYYVAVVATEASKAQWYSKDLTLLQTDIALGDTVIFNSAGGKTGTGEILVMLELENVR